MKPARCPVRVSIIERDFLPDMELIDEFKEALDRYGRFPMETHLSVAEAYQIVCLLNLALSHPDNETEAPVSCACARVFIKNFTEQVDPITPVFRRILKMQEVNLSYPPPPMPDMKPNPQN